MNIPACPPTPTLEELQSDQFVEVDMNELVPNEFVVLRHRDRISCVEIMNNTNDPNGRIQYRFTNNPENTSDQLKRYIYNVIQFYRKVNHRKDFDDVVNETNKLVRSYPPGKKLSSMQSLLATPGIPERVGEYLGGPSSLENPYEKSGGRRKRRLTRRTRKNKRKSTRRVRRKYKK